MLPHPLSLPLLPIRIPQSLSMFTSHDRHQMLPYSPRPLPVIDTGDRWKPIVELAPNCPRCDSSNTKFCYYNNYSLTQPRYFCKGCRRYWTKGGSLRNIPVGGGCRKNRRGKSIRPSRHPVEPNYSNSLRPDLALDGMVGRSTSLTGSGSGSEGSSIDTSGVASDGSTIDLAVLYSKFLNHRPPADSGIIVPELIDVDPFELMCSWVPIEQPEPSQGPPVTLDELDYSDQMSYGSLGFSEGVSDVFVSNCSISPEIQEFHPIPTTDNMVQQHQDLLLGDWSTFVQSNFEQF